MNKVMIIAIGMLGCLVSAAMAAPDGTPSGSKQGNDVEVWRYPRDMKAKRKN